MIFFSANGSEVQQLGKALTGAGIPCEVRKEVMVEGVPVKLPEAELWVQSDHDAHRAFLWCVERNAGFARREINGFALDSWAEGLAA
jgi:hypothetical protein